ncbi:MAG TPA: tetratricopeptide repeat protein [Anaerolineae bacterium]|nr:tetratricopeptide repeat protein [Anaerolineae bacterium]
MGTKHSAKHYALCLMRYALCVLTLFAFYKLTFRLISETHIHRAGNLFRQGYYGLTLNHLKKADHYQPRDYRIQKELGKIYYKLADLQPEIKGVFFFINKAKERYLETLRLNPLDAEAAYALARGEERLERLDRRLHPEEKNNKYNPTRYFKEAIRLRPNGILYHYGLARYLYRQGKNDELVSVAGALTRIYPPSCNYLKKEDFWSPSVREACKSGLQQAIDRKTSLRDAHKNMSHILAEEKELDSAISHYRQALSYGAFNNSAGDYMHLGRLYLKNRQSKDAESSFLKGLELSKAKEKDLERLFSVYKKEGRLEEFCGLCREAGNRYSGSSKMQTLLARSLIDLKQYREAQHILDEINRKEPSAEAYYWLARIAETENDRDRMELSIQKATMLDPSNSQYHLIFSQVLKKRNKLEGAEKEAGLAIKHQAAKPSPWLYNHRAEVRWSMKDYMGAFRDWRFAIVLKPDRASFYAQVAEVCIKMGDWRQAMDYYQKALKLDSGNKLYRKRYQDLKAGS